MLILLVDDDPDFCEITTAILQNEGYQTRVASTAEEGYRHLSERQPDLLLVDVFLPDVNGMEFCRHIREVSDVPVFLVSAAARRSEDFIAGLQPGADDYLAKPLDFPLLTARVQALLRQSTQAAWRQGHPACMDG